jgi:NitT/TauT family transport system substrate-binding protein
VIYVCDAQPRTIRLLLPAAIAILLGFSMPIAARAADQITFLLPAPAALPAFAPWMIARQRGYFTANELEVKFETAQGGTDVAKQVGLGNALLGCTIADSPIIVRSFDVPVKDVAVLGGGGLTQLIVRPTSPILSPAGLKGKVVTVTSYQEQTYITLLGMLAKVGLTKNDVSIQAVGSANSWKLFLAGRADAVAGVPDYVVSLKRNGAEVRVISADKYFLSMAQAVVTGDEAIKTKPEIIRRFVRATLAGMKDIMDDPDGAVTDYVRAVPENSGRKEEMLDVFRLYNEMVYGNQTKLGEIDAGRLAVLQDFYVEQGIARKRVPVTDLYTNEFIPASSLR